MPETNRYEKIMKDNNNNPSRLKKEYETKIAGELAKEFAIKNKMALPRVEKVVVNVGMGEAIKDKGIIESIKKDLAIITGQNPSLRQAKVSVASFGVRKGMPVGLKVTLRGKRMYDFLDKLFSIVLPRLRDFRGLALKSFDGQANYTIGLEEHAIFPEIDTTKVSRTFGLEVTLVTNTTKKKEARRLLELLGMPFEKKEKE